MIEVTASALAAHPFLRGMQPTHLDALAAATSVVAFPAGYRIFEDGGFASRFWLIRSGHVVLDLNVPGEGPVVIEDIGMGGLLGCSWQFPPYRWAFGAVTISPCEAFEVDAPAVRACCAADPVLGYAHPAAGPGSRGSAAGHQDEAARQARQSGEPAGLAVPGAAIRGAAGLTAYIDRWGAAEGDRAGAVVAPARAGLPDSAAQASRPYPVKLLMGNLKCEHSGDQRSGVPRYLD